MSSLKDKFVRAWAADLQARVPEGHRVFPFRRPKTEEGGRAIEPPFSVVTVRRMEQTTPGSNTWIAEARVVCVCDKDEGDSPEQEQRVGEIYAAIEETTVPGVDEDEGVRLYGFSLDVIEQARAEKVFSDVLFVTAGVGDLASSPDAVLIS
jgi:hypothetical protein